MSNKYKVNFYGAPSAYEDKGANCMDLVLSIGEDGKLTPEFPSYIEGWMDEGEEYYLLYAEVVIPDGMDPDDPNYNYDYGYAELRADIIAQAKEKGIPEDMLEFQYDSLTKEPKTINEDILYSVRR